MLDQLKKILSSRYFSYFGYALFFGLVGYSLFQAPDILWRLDPYWLLLTVNGILVMLLVEVFQFFIFLRHHGVRSAILPPVLFSVKKAILNSILPARTGTLFLLHTITETYGLKWHSYIRYMLVVTCVMLLVSVVAVGALLLPAWSGGLLMVAVLLVAWLASRKSVKGYFRQSFWLLAAGLGLYGCRLFIFWTILRASGSVTGFDEAACFAIVTNTLAQVAITPGNIGIREAILGGLAPYLSLSLSIGVIVGALFQTLRIMVYAVIMLALETQTHKRFRGVSSAKSSETRKPVIHVHR